MGTSLFLVAADAATQEPSNAVVVVTGLVLVFAILVLLMLIINLQGAIFTSLDKKKAAKAAAEREAALAAAAAAVPKAPAAAPVAAPVIEDGIPDEVVAAIAAAIASMDGGRYTLRSLTRKKEGRGAWSLAGVVSTTEPF